jgi:hypothetical protein
MVTPGMIKALLPIQTSFSNSIDDFLVSSWKKAALGLLPFILYSGGSCLYNSENRG